MAHSIIGIPTTRLSNLFVRNQLLTQLEANQSDLFKTQTQLSTGYRFQSISEDPVSALSVIGLQSLLQRKSQVQSNIATNQSYLGVTDSALSSVSVRPGPHFSSGSKPGSSDVLMPAAFACRKMDGSPGRNPDCMK